MKLESNFNPFSKDPEAELKRRLPQGKKITKAELFKRIKEAGENVEKQPKS
jgi:hypothetical protein